MKRNHRLISLVLVVILALCMLAACNNETTPPTSTPTPTPTPAATTPDGNEPDVTVPDGPDYGEYSAENPLVLKISTHAYGGDTNIMCVTSETLSAALKEASGGAVQLEVYNEGILTKNDRETIESVIMGTVDMGVSNTAIYCSYVNDYSVLDLCYLFEDIEHVRTFMNSDIAGELMGKMEDADTGVTILSFNYLGAKNVAASRPITNLSDMKGLSLRCSDGEYYLKGFTAFGASPQSISSSEVMASLSQGIIEGVEQSSAIIWSSSYLEYVPYITHTGHIIQMFSININSGLYRSLTPDLQNLIKDTAMKVSTDLFDVSESKQQESEIAMADEGVTFIDIDKTEWIDAMQPVYEDFNSKFGPDWIQTIKALKG